MGTRTMSFHLEMELFQAHGDLVAGLQAVLRHAPAVDLHAVRRSEVRDDLSAALLAQLGVAARDVLVIERAVPVAVALAHEPSFARHPAPTDGDQPHAALA